MVVRFKILCSTSAVGGCDLLRPLGIWFCYFADYVLLHFFILDSKVTDFSLNDYLVSIFHFMVSIFNF